MAGRRCPALLCPALPSPAQPCSGGPRPPGAENFHDISQILPYVNLHCVLPAQIYVWQKFQNVGPWVGPWGLAALPAGPAGRGSIRHFFISAIRKFGLIFTSAN